jgi:hypothetical protein
MLALDSLMHCACWRFPSAGADAVNNTALQCGPAVTALVVCIELSSGVLGAHLFTWYVSVKYVHLSNSAHV